MYLALLFSITPLTALSDIKSSKFLYFLANDLTSSIVKWLTIAHADISTKCKPSSFIKPFCCKSLNCLSDSSPFFTIAFNSSALIPFSLNALNNSS